MNSSDVTATSSPGGRSDDRREQLVSLVMFVILVLGYVVWTWSNELGDWGGDSAIYLLTAQHYSPFTASSPIAAYFAARSPYPPLYPAMLALTGGANSVLAAHLATTACLLLALWVFYRWQRELGLSFVAAVCVMLLFALWPITYLHALLVLSENLFLLCVVLSLWLVTVWQTRGDSQYLWWAAASVAAATLTRGAGVALLAAFLAFLMSHRPRRYGWVAIAAAVPPLLWAAAGPGEGTGYLSLLAGRYQTGGFTALATQVLGQAGWIWNAWANCCTVRAYGPVVMTVAGLIGLVGAAWRALQFRLDGLFVAVYLGLIVIWPFPAEASRLVYVAIPILFVQAVWVLGALPRLSVRERALDAGAFLLVVLAFVALPHLVQSIQRFALPLPSDLEAARRSPAWYQPDAVHAMREVISDRLIVKGLRNARDLIGPQECVYCIKPAAAALHMGRMSYGPPRESLSDADFERYLKEKGCRFVVALNAESPTFPTAFYPVDRLKGRFHPLLVGRAPTDNAPMEIIVGELRQP